MKKIVLILTLCAFSIESIPETRVITNSKTEIKKEVESKLNSNIKELIKSISYVESRWNPDTINVRENAVGYLQIRPVMLREVNRILGHEKYRSEDRFSKEKSIEMFLIVQKFYNPKFNHKIACMIWNEGRTDTTNINNKPYWRKVKRTYERLNRKNS